LQLRARQDLPAPAAPGFAFFDDPMPLPPNNPRNRRSGVVALTGEIPANAVPMPSDTTHFALSAPKPCVASSASVSGPASEYETPPPATRSSGSDAD